jgi:hypothetical protein
VRALHFGHHCFKNNANEQEWRLNKISTFFDRTLGLTNVAQK